MDVRADFIDFEARIFLGRWIWACGAQKCHFNRRTEWRDNLGICETVNSHIPAAPHMHLHIWTHIQTFFYFRRKSLKICKKFQDFQRFDK